jgi:hypothetical protein
MLASRDVRTRTKVATLLASLAVLVTVVQLLAAGSALAASNSVHVKSSKKQIAISGVAATAGDSVQVNFDRHFRTALTHRKTDQVSSPDRQVFELGLRALMWDVGTCKLV